MSLAYFIVVNSADTGFDTFVNGKFVAKEAEVLNQLAAKLDVMPLDEFLSMTELREEFDVDPSTAPVNLWFKAEQGLKTIDTLITHLEQNPKAVRNSKGILEDLHEYQNVFDQVKAKNFEWHFEIDF